ncbi:MAG: RNA methyltransferase [Candidatus Binatia bacterium]
MSDSPVPASGAAPLTRAPAGLRVVLLGPRRGSNVGAACRAIKNMGAGELVVVGGDYDPEEARRTAVHAGDVFASRRESTTFENAVAASTLVIGTTSREEPWSIPVEEVGEVFAQALAQGLPASDVALVFGPEDRGLSNEELARCHRLAFVPTDNDYASLNLAQAVVVCLYEWRQSVRRRAGTLRTDDSVRESREPTGDGSDTTAARPGARARAAAQAAALADWRSVLEEIGFLHGDQDERVMATVTSMLTRGGLDDREVSILRGIARQMRWAARRRPPATQGEQQGEEEVEQ